MFNPRKFLTKTQNPKNTLQRLLTNDEKLEFVKTSVTWISSKDIMDTCFVLNFGYEAPLPWPQVNIMYYYKDLLYACTDKTHTYFNFLAPIGAQGITISVSACTMWS